MRFLSVFIIFLLLSSCKNDQLEVAIRGTYRNNNYQLEITRGVGYILKISGGVRKKIYNRAILYKWEEEHKTFLNIEGPGYYEIHDGEWEIENGNLKLVFYEDGEFKDWSYQIIPINFNPSALTDIQNLNSSFILRGTDQIFVSESISQEYHTD